MRILAVFNVYNTNTEYLLDYICFFFFFFSMIGFLYNSPNTRPWLVGTDVVHDLPPNNS